MTRFFASLALFGLAACGRTVSPPPQTVVPVEVDKIVTRSCVPPQYDRNRPAYPDTDQALRDARDAAERYQLLWAGRGLRSARETENEAVISGCQ